MTVAVGFHGRSGPIDWRLGGSVPLVAGRDRAGEHRRLVVHLRGGPVTCTCYRPSIDSVEVPSQGSQLPPISSCPDPLQQLLSASGPQ